MMRNKLDTEVQYLPGVGPKRASLLRTELEVETVGDLLRTYPFRYIDQNPPPIFMDCPPLAAVS